MEVVGIVLGGIPLVLWALDNYRRALNPAKDYWRYESTLNSISMNIFIQKEQLGVTFHNMGLQGDSLAEVEINLRRRYPDKCDAFMNILAHMNGIVHRLMDKLCIDVEGKVSWPKFLSRQGSLSCYLRSPQSAFGQVRPSAPYTFYIFSAVNDATHRLRGPILSQCVAKMGRSCP